MAIIGSAGRIVEALLEQVRMVKISPSYKMSDLLRDAPKIHRDELIVHYRGVEIRPEFYDDSGVVLHGFSLKSGKRVWDGSTSYEKSDRVVDVIRRAQEASRLGGR